jgi:4-hydroxybenzoate polyprenyltransferase
MSILKKALSFLLYSNLFVSLCVVALALRTALILDVNVDKYFFCFILFSTLFTYHFHRIIRISYKEYSSNNLNWNKLNFKLSLIICLISIAICFVLIFSLKPISLYFLIPLFLISFLYPLKSFSKISLREVPFLKIFLIAIVWMFTTTLLVVTESNTVLSFNLIPLLLDRFLFVLAITIPFDIRDLKYDKNEIKTIPMVFGVDGAKKIAFFCLFLSFTFVVYQFYFLELNSRFLLSHALTCTIAFFLVKYSKTANKDFYFSFFVEGLSLLLLLSYFLIP